MGDPHTEHSSDTGVTFVAELVTDPMPHPVDVVFDLSWRIRRESMPRPLEAGTAELRPSGSELVAWFDYANPHELLGCTVPFGRVVVDESVDPEEASRYLASSGQFSDLDHELLEVLFGPSFVASLSQDELITAAVQRTAKWPTAGRIALGQSLLRRRRLPLDGIWALELAGAVRWLGGGSALSTWERLLLDDAGPALGVLSDGIVSRLKMASGRLDGGTVSQAFDGVMHRLYVAVGGARCEVDLGTYLRSLNQRAVDSLAADAIWDELAAMWRAEGPAGGTAADDERWLAFDEAVLLGGAPVQRNAGRDMSDEEVSLGGAPVQRHAGRVMPVARDLGITRLDWWLEAGQIHLEATCEQGVPGEIGERMEVRVTAPDGRLLAGCQGLVASPDSPTIAHSLPLRNAAADGLVVVIGRDLLVEGISDARVDEAERVVTAQQVADSRRLRSPNGPSSERPFAGEMFAVADGVDALLDDRPDTVTSTEFVAGARSLAQTFGRHGEAAAWEARRQELGTRLGDLGIPELEYLAVAAARDGRSAVAQRLARAVVQLADAELDL